MNVNAFMDTLPVMGKGMVGIFIVTAVIILSVYTLNKISAAIMSRKSQN